jgi:ArsR family transcriptional regulator
MNDLLTIFKALSDETRLRVIKLLENGELCVCDIFTALNMSQPKVSFHLNVLKEAGFLKDRRQGRWTHYRLDDSDFFRRFLLMSVLERIPKEALAKDRSRLDDFLQGKTLKGRVVAIGDKRRCCGENK